LFLFKKIDLCQPCWRRRFRGLHTDKRKNN